MKRLGLQSRHEEVSTRDKQTTPQRGCASLRRIHSPPLMAALRAENQASSEGARAGSAARLTKFHVVRNSGGAVVIKGTGAAFVAASSFKRINSWMMPTSSTIGISGMTTGAGNWLRAMVSLGHASGCAGVSCSLAGLEQQPHSGFAACCGPRQHADAGTMSASKRNARICQRRFIFGTNRLSFGRKVRQAIPPRHVERAGMRT